MRPFTVTGCATLLAMLLLSPFSASASAQYVLITDPFVNVYERLDPKSNVLVMAKKGDRFNLLYAGPLWYQVNVKNQIGWIERKAGRVVEGKNALSLIISIAVVLALTAGTVYIVASHIKKQKTA
ncbi:MAG: hypothetical protein JW699_00330 [Chitinispirillaceae bacterium]|nr:hypothetical protein [Chitinispirillaceae bacterium]